MLFHSILRLHCGHLFASVCLEGLHDLHDRFSHCNACVVYENVNRTIFALKQKTGILSDPGHVYMGGE